MSDMIIAAKSAPQEDIFCDIKKAGLRAIELYLSGEIFNDLHKTIALCKKFAFRYAIHAPNNKFALPKLRELVRIIGAEIVVFHNIFWEDEWKNITKAFKDVNSKLCIENTYSVHEPLKFMRRYNLGRCLDLEHLQMECAGIFEEEFIRVIKEASHIHLSGYIYGTKLWHTHIHYSPEHSRYLLDLLKRSGYSGFVVSEAKTSLQNYSEFKKLNDFYGCWEGKK